MIARPFWGKHICFVPSGRDGDRLEKASCARKVTKVQEVLLNYGLPGVVILALSYAVRRLYADQRKTQDGRVEDLQKELAARDRMWGELLGSERKRVSGERGSLSKVLSAGAETERKRGR